MERQIDWTLPQRDIILTLIARDNEQEEVDLTSFILDKPMRRIPTEDIPRNTSIRLTAIPTSTYYGERIFYYNRVDINDFKYDGLIDKDALTIKLEGETSSKELAPKISSILGALITEDMLFDLPIPLLVKGELPWELIIDVNCFTMYGRLSITLKR